MPAHLRAAASDVQPVSMCTFLSTFVYFFCDSIVIPHLLLLRAITKPGLSRHTLVQL